MTTSKPYPYPLSNRNPYPYPQYENDDTFKGKPYKERIKGTTVPRETERWEDPWNRVNRHHTLSSMRHEVCYVDRTAPRDSLDIVLKSVYSHGHEFLRDKSEVLLQPETLHIRHGRILKNRTFNIETKPPALGHPLRVSYWHRSEHPSYMKLPIIGPHDKKSNRGYNRKESDGTVLIH